MGCMCVWAVMNGRARCDGSWRDQVMWSGEVRWVHGWGGGVYIVVFVCVYERVRVCVSENHTDTCHPDKLCWCCDGGRW